MTTETTYDKKADKTNTYNKLNNPQDNSIAGETAPSLRPETQVHKESTIPQTNYKANRETNPAGDQNADVRNPNNQNPSGNKSGTGVKDGITVPNPKTPIAGGDDTRMRGSDGAAIAPNTNEPRTGATQTPGRRDDTQRPNTAAKKIDDDAPNEQRTPQT